MSLTHIFEPILALVLLVPWPASAQVGFSGGQAPDAFQRQMPTLQLQDEYFAAGVAKLNMMAPDVGFSIEFIGGTAESGPPQDPKLRGRLAGATLKEALDWLCSLDPRYTWVRDGHMVNIFPKDVLRNPNYLFQRKVPTFDLKEVQSADDAVSQLMQALAKPRPTFITWRALGNFAEPCTASFGNVTVRQALNRIVQQLGQGYGWLAFGSSENIFFSVHRQLTVHY